MDTISDIVVYENGEIELKISADKDKDGNYIPSSIHMTFEDSQINEAICSYLNCKQQMDLISYEDKPMNTQIISGVTFTKDGTRLIIRGIVNAAEFISLALGALSDANIELDMIVHNVLCDGSTDFTFTIKRSDLAKTSKVLENIVERFENLEIITIEKVGKISLVGIGMRSHADITSKIFKVLADKGVDIQLIVTSEIKVSVLMDEKYVESSVNALHKAFNLAEEPESCVNE